MGFLSLLLFASSSDATIPYNTIIRKSVPSSSCIGRSLRTIIISCFTTLFLCAWTAVHPNMPGPLESTVVIGFRRLGAMILALVAPEMILLWAMHQLIAAQLVQKRFQKALWDGTLELRVKPRCGPRLVSAKVPYDAEEVRMTIPEEMTTSWSGTLTSLCSSISTIFRRPSSHVHEMLGPSLFAVGSMKGYCRWTLKHSFFAWMGGFVLFVDGDPVLPCEVYHPLTPDELLEFLKADLVQVSMVSERELDGRSKGDWLSKAIAIIQLVWFIVQLAARAFEKLPTTQLEITSLATSVLGCFIYASWWYKPKDAQCSVPVYYKKSGELPEIKYSTPRGVGDFFRQAGAKNGWFEDHFEDIMMLRPMLNLGGITSVSDAAVKAHRVPYLCGYYQDVDKEGLGQSLPVYTVGALAGMVFGGVHCIAWNFTFPTYTEQMLWRISSLVMAVMPALSLLIVIYVYTTIHGVTVPHAAMAAGSMVVVQFLYISGRLAVIVLTLLSLRSLSDGVYDEVCWTSLIPHWL